MQEKHGKRNPRKRSLQLSRDVVTLNAVSSSAKLLYSILQSLSYKAGYCFAYNKTLAKLAGLSVRTIQRTLIVMQKAGLIEVLRVKTKGNIERRIKPLLTRYHAL